MKKIKFLILIIFTVSLTACSFKKETIDEDEFIGIMKREGFNLVNVENEYDGYDYFEEVYVAKKGEYEIQFYEFENDSYAKKLYDKNKQQIELEKSGSYKESNIDLFNNNKYTLDAKGVYTVVSRIEDTIIYLSVSNKYKEEVNNILKKLGY